MTFFLLGLLTVVMLFVLFIHRGFKAPVIKNLKTPQDMKYEYENVSFQTRNDKTLSGWWIMNTEPSDHTVILLHGWGANKSLMLPLTKPFIDMGLNVFLFDARNHGDSAKDGISSMPKFSEDLTRAIEFVKNSYPDQAVTTTILGHSVGAAASLLTAVNTDRIDSIILLACFAHPQAVINRYLHKLRFIPGMVWLVSFYVQKVIGHSFDSIAPVNSIQKINKPLLLIHGKRDNIIPIHDHKRLCSFANSNLSECIALDDVEHDSIEKIEPYFFIVKRFLRRLNA